MKTANGALGRAAELAGNISLIEESAGIPYQEWRARCHSVSLRVLRTGLFGPGRVARGTAAGVGSQHSWIVLGDDVYDPGAVFVDPTLLSWHDPGARGIYTGLACESPQVPHGSGHISGAKLPVSDGGPPVRLQPAYPLSPSARAFLAGLGPLDIRGWAQVAHLPAGGWPAAEIIAAMDDTPGLRALVPVDILGMLTDRNPGRLYR